VVDYLLYYSGVSGVKSENFVVRAVSHRPMLRRTYAAAGVAVPFLRLVNNDDVLQTFLLQSLPVWLFSGLAWSYVSRPTLPWLPGRPSMPSARDVNPRDLFPLDVVHVTHPLRSRGRVVLHLRTRRWDAPAPTSSWVDSVPLISWLLLTAPVGDAPGVPAISTEDGLEDAPDKHQGVPRAAALPLLSITQS